MNHHCVKCKTALVSGETSSQGKIRFQHYYCPTCRVTRAISSTVGG